MIVYKTNPKLFIDKANILKAMAHPQRLCIVKTLCEKGSLTVTDMLDCMDEAQSTVSQHLAKLKAAGIITGARKGTNIFYSFRDEETRKFIQGIIREIFSDTGI